MPFWISKAALDTQSPIQRKAYWDSLHQKTRYTSFLRCNACFHSAALEQTTACDMMQRAGRSCPAMGPLKTPYENSCTCTRNFETSTMITNFPLRLGNNFASLNTPCTRRKTCFSNELPQGKWWTLCGRTSRNKKTPNTTAQISSFFFQAKLFWHQVLHLSMPFVYCIKGCSIRNLSPADISRPIK